MMALIPILICKRRVFRKRKGEQCLKFNTNIYIAFGGQCDRGYYGEFKKMRQDILHLD